MNSDSILYISDIGQIIEVNAVSYSFDTLGWRIVGLLSIIGILIVVVISWRRYIKNAYRRSAAAQINSWVSQREEDAPYLINEMVKKLCVGLYGRRRVAPLYGKDWLVFLDTTMPDCFLDKSKIEIYSRAIYDTEYQMSQHDLISYQAFMLHWVKIHNTDV